MAFENYTIQQFMDALYKGDRDIIQSKDELDEIHSEYIDTSGLYDKEEFQKSAYIHSLNHRINTIKLAIKLQKDFLMEFEVPYKLDFPRFKKYGHTVKWNDDIANFMAQLQKIEDREFKYISQLEGKIKELKEFRDKKVNKETTVKQSRTSFINTLISLGKLGYAVDKNKTTMEEYSLMIRKQLDEKSK